MTRIPRAWLVVVCLLTSLLPPGNAMSGARDAFAASAEPRLLGARLSEVDLHGSAAARTVLPAWYRQVPGEAQTPETPHRPAGTQATSYSVLPTWYPADLASLRTAPPATPPASSLFPAWYDALGDGLRDQSRLTLYRNNVTVSGPPQIDNCQAVTYTIVVRNDAVTSTNVVLTSAMPSGFNPREILHPIGTMAPGQVLTYYDRFDAGCTAVSGQHTATFSEDGQAPFTVYTDFLVNPGAITLRKLPSVTPARIGDVVTWTVIVENTGYGSVSNVQVSDVLSTGLE